MTTTPPYAPRGPNPCLQQRAIASVIIAFALLAILVGCGEGQNAKGPTPLTESQLAKKMGLICQNHTDRQVVAIQRFEKQHGILREGATATQLEGELVRVILPIVRDTLREIEQLRPPESKRAEFKAFIRALRHGIVVSEGNASWIATGDFEPFKQARSISAALGTYLCGQA